jgi:hypothetical protein
MLAPQPGEIAGGAQLKETRLLSAGCGNRFGEIFLNNLSGSQLRLQQQGLHPSISAARYSSSWLALCARARSKCARAGPVMADAQLARFWQNRAEDSVWGKAAADRNGLRRQSHGLGQNPRDE